MDRGWGPLNFHHRRWGSVLAAASTLALILLFPSCALYNPTGSQGISKICKIPTDESATIIGQWAAVPIPMAFSQGQFVAAETLPMTNAIDTWNKFFTESKGINVMDYGGNNGSPRNSNAVTNASGSPLCSQGLLQGTVFNGNFMIYKLGSWPYGATTIALTRSCTNPGATNPRMYMSVMELNYQYYFVQGQKQPDLQSIMLHELGHLLGLNHTCEFGSTKTGMPDCNSPTLDPSYKAASLFPNFNFDTSGFGEQRQSLGTNDQERANCLYGTQ